MTALPPPAVPPPPPVMPSPIKRNGRTLRYLVVFLGLILLTLGMVLGVVLIRRDADNTPIVAVIVGFMTPTIASVMGFLISLENRMAIETVHVTFNSKMDEMLQMKKEEGRAEGAASERPGLPLPPHEGEGP